MKPQVAIVYSHSSDQSDESKNIAYYLTGMLLATGYCTVQLIGHETDGSPCQYPTNQRILYAPTFGQRCREVAVSHMIKCSDWQ